MTRKGGLVLSRFGTTSVLQDVSRLRSMTGIGHALVVAHVER
jgi:hypothetical protein